MKLALRYQVSKSYFHILQSDILAHVAPAPIHIAAPTRQVILIHDDTGIAVVTGFRRGVGVHDSSVEVSFLDALQFKPFYVGLSARGLARDWPSLNLDKSWNSR